VNEASGWLLYVYMYVCTEVMNKLYSKMIIIDPSGMS